MAIKHRPRRPRKFALAQARRRIGGGDGAQARQHEYDRAHNGRGSTIAQQHVRVRTVNPDVLCYDAASGQLRGNASSPYYGLPVELVDLYEDSQSVLIRHSSLPDGELVVPLCGDDIAGADAFRATPLPPSPPPSLDGCCIDEASGLITCPGGEQQWFMHGRTVPAAAMSCYTDAAGRRSCQITTGDTRYELPACDQPPSVDEVPPACCVDVVNMVVVCEDPSYRLHGASVTEIMNEQPDGLLSISFVDPTDGVTKHARLYPCEQPPQTCCYDVASGSLRCDSAGGLDGKSVSLVAMEPQPDGSIHALVQSDDLGSTPSRFPICDDQVVDCCYDPTTEQLVCPGSDLDGQPAGIVASWTGNDGQVYVWATWNGGGARIPICPGTRECPPVFCCVNMQTMAFVCPGRAELNGQPATLSDIVVEDGYTWGVLDDGTRLPMCGKECPPPKLCPDCPSCPPGQWMSPDGSCEDPPRQECPQCPPCPPGVDPCPPGLSLDPATGTCRPCPNPSPKPCCDGCAHGHGCEGEKTDAHENPGRPLRRSRTSRRKRRIFAGNR